MRLIALVLLLFTSGSLAALAEDYEGKRQRFLREFFAGDATQWISEFGTNSAEVLGRFSSEELLVAVKDDNKQFAYYAMRRIFSESSTVKIVPAIEKDLIAKVMCWALENVDLHNDWGFYSASSITLGVNARLLIDHAGSAAIPSLKAALRNTRILRYFGSEVNVISRNDGVRVCDVAYVIYRAIEGSNVNIAKDMELRNKLISDELNK